MREFRSLIRRERVFETKVRQGKRTFHFFLFFYLRLGKDRRKGIIYQFHRLDLYIIVSYVYIYIQ